MYVHIQVVRRLVSLLQYCWSSSALLLYPQYFIHFNIQLQAWIALMIVINHKIFLDSNDELDEPKTALPRRSAGLTYIYQSP